MISTDEWSIDASGTLVMHDGPEIDDLDLAGRTDLVALPDEMQVLYNLRLSGCTSLVRMPRNLIVDYDLYLDGCTSLETIEGSMHVFGSLVLDGCTALRSLPDDLIVGQGLYAKQCPKLARLPDVLKLGDLVDTDRFVWFGDDHTLRIRGLLPETVVACLPGRKLAEVMQVHPWLEQFGAYDLRIMDAEIYDFMEELILHLEQREIAYDANTCSDFHRFNSGKDFYYA